MRVVIFEPSTYKTHVDDHLNICAYLSYAIYNSLHSTPLLEESLVKFVIFRRKKNEKHEKEKKLKKTIQQISLPI